MSKLDKWGQKDTKQNPSNYKSDFSGDINYYADNDRRRQQNAQKLDNLENNTENLNKDSLIDQENEGQKIDISSWQNNVSGKKESNETKGKFSFIKKKGPLSAIILTLVGGGIGITSLLSPGLLIIQLKETMVNKFNTQLSGMDIRTKKIIRGKVLGGECSLIPIACKYKTMSTKQVTRLRNAGIDVVEFEPSTFSQRVKPTKIEYQGKEIKPQDFYKKLDTDPNFRLSVKKAYNPLFASFYDNVWNKKLFYIDKNGVHLAKGDDTVKLNDIKSETKKAVELDEKGVSSEIESKKTADGDVPDDTGKTIDSNQIDDAVTDITNKADDVAETGRKAATEVAETSLKEGAKMSAQVATNLVKATGWLDNACVMYGGVKAVGYAAKTVRAVQLIAYASVFLKIADQIKAGGNPDPDDISYLGNVLTTETETVNSDGTTSIGSATDSFGYKYAAYGEVGKMPDTATQFLAGAGFAGSLILITSYINNVFKVGGLDANSTCKVSQNIFFQIGSAIAGIAIGVSTGGAGTLALSAGMVAQGLGAVAIMVGVSLLPSLLADIVAGVVVDESTVGHLAGDAITSGSSAMMGKLALGGGNAPLTVDQAVAHANLSSKIANEYAEEDRIAHSPFDISNSNTFLGSFTKSILPYLTKMSSIPNSINSLTSLTKNSLASAFLPNTYATTADEFSICQDYDYKELGLATDPFCNLYYGVPVEDLENISPEEVLITLEGSGDIDKDTGEIIPNSDLDEFQKNCIDRKDPIGYSGADFQADDGKACIIGESDDDNTKYYYLYLIDKRVEDGMSGDDDSLNLAYEMGLDSNPNIAFYDGVYNQNNNIASESFFSKIINFFGNLFNNKRQLSYE